MKKITLLFFAVFTVGTLTAQQFDLSAEIRPRFENKHGYGTLLDTDVNGASFISQRSRLNFNFENEKLRVGVTLQNVRVWGDVFTLAYDDKSTKFHEVWGEAIFNENLSLKLGRQEIIYDDHRIFGDVGWTQQARSHDAALLKYKVDEKSFFDFGFAYNADNESGVDYLYSNIAGYKAFQYAYYHRKNNGIGVSLLFLNNGVEYENVALVNEVQYSQTFGGRLTVNKGNFISDFATYLQTGNLKGNKVSASYFTGNVKYKITSNYILGVGAEYLSGKDMDDTGTDVKNFVPLYGTNHKFNGWMDYFYAGSPSGTAGLVDINAVLAYKKDKFSAKLIPHLFSAAGDIYDGTTKMERKLGTEIDFTASYKIADNMKLDVGYSKMYATESMEIVKGGGDSNENNSWTWVMFTFKPKLFSTKK